MKWFFILLLFLFSVPASAELYKWVDKEGKVHFSDKPVEGTHSETVEIKQQPKLGQDADSLRAINQRLQRLRQAESEADAIEQNAKQKKEEQESKIARTCVRYKHKLNIFRGSVYRLNDEGERVYMSNAEIAQEREKIQTWIDQNC